MKTNPSCYKNFPFGLAKAILLPFMFLVMFLSSAKAQEYCTPPASVSPCEYGSIENVTTTGGTSSNINITTGCNADSYTDFSSSQSVTQEAGGTIDMILTPEGEEMDWSVWVDFNDDGTFSSEERVIAYDNIDGDWEVYTSFVVPSDAPAGSHVMRIRCDYYDEYGQATGFPPSDPCAQLEDGETEDYMLIVGSNPAPTVTTQDATSIALYSATGNGTITKLGDSNPTAHGFCWNTTGTPNITDTHNDLGGTSTTGTFSSSITSLQAGTTYSVRAYATNTAGTAYGVVKSFTTTGLPALTTQDVTGILSGTATGNGTITDLGLSNPTAHGFCWTTTGTPGITGTHNDLGATSTTGTFSSAITGLTPQETYYIRAYATNTVGTAYGVVKSFTTTNGKPTVTTQAVTNILFVTATGNGTITDLGDSDPTAHGFCWNTTGTPDIAGTHNDLGGTSTTGTFSSAITGLQEGTTYYLRAYVTNTQGTAYGAEESFTTNIAGSPAVTTQAVTDILSGTATGHGTITDLGASNPTAYGICWGTYNNPDLGYYFSHTDEGGTSSTGAFSSNLTGLTQNQTYYVRAYATNAQGTAYGNEVSFTTITLSPPAVTTQAVTDIGYTTATGNGNLTALGVPNATAYGVCWNTAGTPTISDSHTDKGSASATGAFTSSITGLLSATTYYVRAYATNASGTVYGSEVSFPTSNPFNWYAIGTGANSEIFSIAVSGNDVYAGGLFTSIGGTGINGIAKWNGTVWTGLGAGVDDGAVLAIAVNGNDVYIGGIFTNVSGTSIPKIAKWNGSSWSSITTTAPPDGNVSSLLIFNNELYAAGSFVNIDGILVNGIAKWNGTTWSAMGTGASGGSVQTLATDGSNLYAGGAFLAINGIPANGIAKWDGNQWSALGTGIVGAVSAIAIMNGNVYAGGSFINASGVDNTRNLAKWDGTNWSSIGVLDLGTRISALAASNGALYAGGYFDAISGVSANNIAKWNGNSWSRIGTVASNGVNLTVNSLAVQSSSSSMIVGGSFPQTNAISNGTYISRFTDNFNSFPAELVWTGTTSTNWNISTNWSTGSVPTASDNVIIPNVTNDPVVTQSGSSLAVCNNITIASGAVVTIATGKSLTVNGTLTNSAGVTGLVVNSGGSLIESTAGVSATVKSDIPANEWHLISVPVTNATSNVFLGRYLQTHSESTNAYTDITPTNNTLTPMKGFALYGEGGFTSTYTGPLNTATQSYSTAYSGVSNGWNLVGNPYPSSIDWSAASGWTKTNVNNAIYIHVNAATWATFNGSGTNGGTRYIAPGQGFFVQASAAGTLAMTNAVKVHNATTFFKNAEATVPNLLRLQVSGNGYSDEAVVHFAPEATAEFDGSYDAHKLYGDVPEAAQVYTLGSIPLAINSLPATSTVPMGIYTGAAGTYTLAATEINDLTGVTLEDTHTGIFTDLTKSPCSVELAAGESGQRFILHFGLLSIEEKESSPASIYSYRHTAYIRLNENTSGDIFIYSISGQLVATIPSASGIKEVQLPVSGTYIVKVVAEKATEVRKIFIN